MPRFRALVFLFGLTIVFLQLQAQTNGEIYYSLTDYIKHKADTAQITILRRNIYQIANTGGNDYKITSNNSDLKNKLKSEVWGVRANDSLYLNCLPLGLTLWYAYAKKIGNRLFFTAAIPLNKEQQENLGMISTLFGVGGGLIYLSQFSQKRAYYTMDIKTGTTLYLSKEKMIEILTPYPDLVQKYKFEIDPEIIDVLDTYLAEYMNLLNQKPK
jgi:hypothetical protein